MTMTTAAQAAKAIRAELKNKFPQIKFSVRSENYAGGNSINISYNNAIPSDEIEKIANKYQDGNFDGMIDLYEYKKNPDNLPRAKYVFVNRHIDDVIRDGVKKDIAKKFGIENANDETSWREKFHCWSDQIVWKELQKMTF